MYTSMNTRFATLVIAGAVVGVTTGCTSSAVQPSGKISVAAPSGVLPTQNATLRFIDQPITLSINNGVVAEPSATTYTFEVSTDVSFSNKVQTKSGVAQSAGDVTSVKLDPLAGSTDYYWHARTEAGGTVGVFGPTFTFKVGPPITVSAVTLVSPAAAAETGSLVTFVVNNAQRTGPAGPITYRLEVSTSPTFGSLVFDQTVAEGGGGRTSFSSDELPAETNLYWRVTPRDPANDITGQPSATSQLFTKFAIDLTKVVYLKAPNISSWKRTGFLFPVEQDGATGDMCTRFTDPGWPDVIFPYLGPDDDPNFGVYANQWYFAKIGGTWYGGAGEWIYRAALSVCKGGQLTNNIGPDSGFGEPFKSWRPAVGELVGYAITSIARNGYRSVDQRTQVLVQPWRDSSR